MKNETNSDLNIFLYPTAGDVGTGPEKKQMRPKLVNKGAAGTGFYGQLMKHHNNNAIKLGILGFAVLGIAVLIVAVVWSRSSPDSPIMKVSKAACKSIKERTSNEGIISPVEVNLCNKLQCKFDTSQCSEQCPFGYTMDDKLVCEVDCNCAQKGIIQGDVTFTEEDLPRLYKDYLGEGSFISLQSEKIDIGLKLWSVGSDNRVKVPYFVNTENGIDRDALPAINAAVEWLSMNTCADFILATDEYKHRVEIEATEGLCGSTLGLRKERSRRGGISLQSLYVSRNCFHLTGILHEFMHTLGLRHEHIRSDRDAYITVNYENLLEGSQWSYRAMDNTPDIKLGFEYHIESIMHETSDIGTPEGLYWYVKKSDGQPHTKRPELPTAKDIAKLHKIYGCDAPGKSTDSTGKWSEWKEWSSCSKACSGGIMKRYRKCQNSKGAYLFNCDGEAYEMKTCGKGDCPKPETKWGRWGKCSQTCGKDGKRTRTKYCRDRPDYRRSKCLTDNSGIFETESCNVRDCNLPIPEASWNDWSSWPDCPVRESCEGKKLVWRHRQCHDGLSEPSLDCPPTGQEAYISKSKYQIGHAAQNKTCVCSEEGRKKFKITTKPPLYVTPTADPDKLVFEMTMTHATFFLCNYNLDNSYFSQWLIEEFDENPGPDVFCLDSLRSYYKFGYGKKGFVSKVDLEGRFPYCRKIVPSDFDGDGLKEVFCIDRVNKEMGVYKLKDGNFQDSQPFVIEPFCLEKTGTMFVRDVNGDGRTDIVCRTREGILKIRYAVVGDWAL